MLILLDQVNDLSKSAKYIVEHYCIVYLVFVGELKKKSLAKHGELYFILANTSSNGECLKKSGFLHCVYVPKVIDNISKHFGFCNFWTFSSAPLKYLMPCIRKEITVRDVNRFWSSRRKLKSSRQIEGTYKVRNEIETKRNEINENETKRNETKSTKWKRKQNEINENKTKYDDRLLPTHVSVSFIRRGQDFITIEQEYYAFIQRESVFFT